MEERPVKTFQTPLEKPSPYHFGDGIAALFPRFLRRYDFDRCFVITSRKLLRLLGRDLIGSLTADGVAYEVVLIHESEAYKTWETVRDLCEELVDRGATRDSVLLSLGGGVIGNVVGLTAALLYRGVRFIEIPTTVMSMTDGTLSNKQAINGRRGKNQFGAYHAPLFIWADVDYPRHEPVRQKKSGIVEGIKNVLVSHDSTAEARSLLAVAADPMRFSELLWRLIESKLSILERDPTEKGYCVLLEYGHTFGHAIEWLSKGRLRHGEAVAIGMCLAAELSHAVGLGSQALVDEHYHLLEDILETPTRLPRALDRQALYDTMLADNKRTGAGLRFLLLRGCGDPVNPDGDYMVSVDRKTVLTVLEGVEGSPIVPVSDRRVAENTV